MNQLKYTTSLYIYIFCNTILFGYSDTNNIIIGDEISNGIPTETIVFTCQDGIQNGDETGIDCGGAICPPCNGNGACGSAVEFPMVSAALECHPSLGVLFNLYYEGGGVSGYQFTKNVDGILGQFTLSDPLPNIGDQLSGVVLGFGGLYGTQGYSFNVETFGCDPNQILFSETIQSIDCPSPCNSNVSCGSAAEFPMISTSLTCDPNEGPILTFFYEGGGVGGYQFTVDTDGILSQFTLSCPLPNIGDQLFGIVYNHPSQFGIPGNTFEISVTGCDPNIILYTEFVQSINCLPACNDPSDYIALRALYLSTDGDNWSDNSGWPDANFFNANPTIPSGVNMSYWNGLTCQDGRINNLQIPNNNLNGFIPTEIGLLSELENLILGSNNLSGPIPIELWDLTKLYHLELDNGSLTGQLPSEIGNLSKLSVLLLDNNNLSGSLPIEMKALINMRWITLNDNSFSGTIDDDFFDNWEQVHDIRFQSNQFSGDLPNSLGNRTSLRVALFGNNQFTGCFPYNYKNLCTNKDNFPNAGFDFSGNVALGTNDGDFDAFCSTEAGLCATTIDCHWIELTINTGNSPLFFNYNLTPFDYNCNGGTRHTGEYYLNTELPNTSLSYVHELEESWYGMNIQNELYDGSDLTQTIEVKDLNSGAVIVPQTPIEYYFGSDVFPVCNPQIINQNLTVTNNNDSGPGSLRQAITDANCTYGKDDITILTTGTINLTSCNLDNPNGCFIILPDITDDVCITGNGITLTSNTTGRLFYNRSNLTIKDMTIDNINYSTFQGGTGGAIWNGGSLDLQNVTISNTHTSGAGAIYSYGDVDIENCTFSNNSAGDSGGAIFINTGTCHINHATFSDNSAPEGGAIYIWDNGTIDLENSIVANSVGDGDIHSTSTQGINDINLVESCVGNCPTFLITADPQLGPLQDNGGVTYTHALQAGTPGSVVTRTILLANLAGFATEIISYTPNGCGAVTVSVDPSIIQYPCNLGDDGIIGTADDGICNAGCSYADDGNGSVTISLLPSGGDPNGNEIPQSAVCMITVNVAQCNNSSPAIDALAVGSVLLDQRGYDIFNGEKDLGAYEFGGVDADGCDLVEFEGTDIMGNTEESMAHLMVGGDNTIDMNADVLYQAGELIDLKPGFEVVQGSVFEAQIGPCTGPSFLPVLSPATGRIWMDRNLGASQVATSSTDIDSYGDYYQWGRDMDGHQDKNSNTTSTLSVTDDPGHGDYIIGDTEWRIPFNPNVWQGANGINNPCPSGYRIPTKDEFEAELQSWTSTDAAGAMASPLKLPLAGYRSWTDGDGITLANWRGNYWANTSFSSVGSNSMDYLSISVDNAALTSNAASGEGQSIRCIKD